MRRKMCSGQRRALEAALVLALCASASAFAPIHGGAAARALGGRRLGRISPANRPSTARLAAPETAVLGGIDDSAWERPASKGKREVVIGTKINTLTPVVTTKPDPGCELGAYMSLPPEQYVLIPLPNNAKLERINGGNFRLKVQELQFLNVWVRPLCEAKVDVTKEGVIIEVTKCVLEGSPEVKRLDINSRFEVSMKVVLSAKEDSRGLRSVMVGRSELNVWVDPPSIFRTLFPKRLMESTGNSVLRTSLNALQTTFLKGLALDYDKWASDPEYRKTRENAGAAPRHA